MPRCPDACSKVQEQLRQLEAAARELVQNNIIYQEPPINHKDSEVQTSDDISGIANERSEVTSKLLLIPNKDEISTRSQASIPSSRGTAIIRSKNRSGPSQKSQYRTSHRNLAGYAIVSNYSGINIRSRQTKSVQNQTQMDEYFLNKGLNYFENFCDCSLDCVLSQAFRDQFIWTTLTSLAFFATGVKLCFELDAWTIPNSFF